MTRNLHTALINNTVIVAVSLAGFYAAIFPQNVFSSDENTGELFADDSSPTSYVRVSEVIRADTIVLESGEKVVLIGLKAPDLPARKKIQYDDHGMIIAEPEPVTSLEEEAFNFARRLLEGKKIRLEFDSQKRNDHLETLAYVFLEDGTFANGEILRYGFADFSIMPLNKKYERELRAAYQDARREKRGLQGE